MPRCVTTFSGAEFHSEKINEIKGLEAGLVAPEKDASVQLRRVRGVELAHHVLTNEDLPRRETWIGTPPELMRSSQTNRENTPS